MIRFAVLGILLWVCFGCGRGETRKLRGEELCDQIDSVFLPDRGEIGPLGEISSEDSLKLVQLDSLISVRLDSLVALSAGLPEGERFAVLCKAFAGNRVKMILEMLVRYLQEWSALPSPDVKDKATGLLMVENCIHTSSLKQFAPHLYDPEWMATLFFNVENRWKLTPEEECRLLTWKAKFYSGVLNEYKSALDITTRAAAIAQQFDVGEETLMKLFRTFFGNYMRLQESDSLTVIGRDFVEIAEIRQFSARNKAIVYSLISFAYEKQKDYGQALYWLKKTGRLENGSYVSSFTDLYLAADSISGAMAYIERNRATNHRLYDTAKIAWGEACVRQRMGDCAGYERCLTESVRIFDLYPRILREVNFCAPSEAYARLLWQQGKRKEAILRMERVTRLLTYRIGGELPLLMFEDMEKRIGRLRLLVTYYHEAGQEVDALRQTLLCDSLQRVLDNARLEAERNKIEARMYVADLSRNLELKAANFANERQKFRFICFVLGAALLGIVVLWVLYRQRERQLNVLYARQKEIEQLQVEKQRMMPARAGKLSPEEELFRELERRFYGEELFRNPGFSRDDLCRLGGSNRMYISTCINKYAGTNINQWINKARIDYAIRLIGGGEDDLTKLSEQSGFASLKSFFRSFKQFTELTPRQYIVREREAERQNCI